MSHLQIRKLVSTMKSNQVSPENALHYISPDLCLVKQELNQLVI